MKVKIKIYFVGLWVKTKQLGAAFKREANETYIASKILLDIINKKDVTPEQIKFLKEQSIDFGKALAIIGLQAIPGSSVAIIALEQVAKKHGFSLFPTDQTDPVVASVKNTENTETKSEVLRIDK